MTEKRILVRANSARRKFSTPIEHSPSEKIGERGLLTVYRLALTAYRSLPIVQRRSLNAQRSSLPTMGSSRRARTAREGFRHLWNTPQGKKRRAKTDNLHGGNP
ncbi:hypothetical protein AKJ62_03520 [candidate division MSBL1 archaeon SCGC-AAA259D14]|uniref:Uncharacterized protein n=1 Tax=candidate division MSBL1 archaeon SCGC-AAA259D14 TaxID=1698261 RepID=A0A133U4W1_9EURY|nr:hypothetical protein AKJ62_03520 [candidate division MSBL1 archaeon SCGC-AAA259D14]